MIKNLIEFVAKDGKAEYSLNLFTHRVNLFTLDYVCTTHTNVMFITATKIDLETDENGEPYKMMDYTVIFNGLPTPKNLLRVCEKDVEAAKKIIEVLKREDVFELTAEYWNFDKEEWEDELDDVLFHYKESVSDIKCTPNVDTVKGLMDVYSKKGYNFKVGAKKYLNGDYSNNGSAVELYTIDSDWKPKFYITIHSKDGGVISDSEIKSHIEIFYEK